MERRVFQKHANNNFSNRNQIIFYMISTADKIDNKVHAWFNNYETLQTLRFQTNKNIRKHLASAYKFLIPN